MFNHLEQLVYEFLDWKGYCVWRNIRVGKREKGGYEGELDIVAFHPSSREVLHIELSLDSNRWDKRKEKFSKKFALGKKYICEVFLKNLGLDEKSVSVQQIAYVPNKGYVKDKESLEEEIGAKIRILSELLREIVDELKKKDLRKDAIPENYPLLRTIQFVTHYVLNS